MSHEANLNTLLLCYRVNQHSKALAGVFQKFLGQIEGFLESGVSAYGLFMSLDTLCLARFNRADEFEVLHCIPGMKAEDENQQFWLEGKKLLAQYNLQFDIVYCRYDVMCGGDALVRFLREARNRGSRTVLEFATYPYEQEIKEAAHRETDVSHRLKISSCVDLVVSTSFEKKIEGLDILHFDNKIRGSAINLNHDSYQFNPDCIQFAGVANLSFWHGYDRLILSMATFNQQWGYCPCHFHIIGVGDEMTNLVQLVQDNELSEHVSFHGFLSDIESRKMLLKMDVGVDSLAPFRKGLRDSSSLKARGYMAAGVPVVTACRDPELQDSGKVIRVSNDNEEICLQSLLDFFKQIPCSIGTRSCISEYALKNLTWSRYSQNLLDRIKQGSI